MYTQRCGCQQVLAALPSLYPSRLAVSYGATCLPVMLFKDVECQDGPLVELKRPVLAKFAREHPYAVVNDRIASSCRVRLAEALAMKTSLSEMSPDESFSFTPTRHV